MEHLIYVPTKDFFSPVVIICYEPTHAMAWSNVQYNLHFHHACLFFLGGEPRGTQNAPRVQPPRIRHVLKGIFYARKATFRHRESKASKTPALRRHLKDGSWQTFTLMLPVDGRGNRVLSPKNLRHTALRLGTKARVITSRTNRRLFARLV